MDPKLSTVQVAEIRSMMNAALDALEAAGVEQLSVESDSYWTVYFDEAFDMTKRPEPVVGSLSGDVDDLRAEINARKSDEGGALWHVFHHLGGLVQLMAEQSRLRSL